MDATTPIRILIVDDHDVVRRGLKVFLRVFDDLEFAGEASNGAQAVSFCESDPPDVILMDLIMPDMDGIEATRIIHERFPQVRIIALTSLKDDELVQAALDAGAVTFVLKNTGIDELADTIRRAFAHPSS